MQRRISEKTVIARKAHDETSSQWFRDDLPVLFGLGLTLSEWKVIITLKNNKWKILPGQQCETFTGIDCDGEIYTAHYLKEIDDIVEKYELAERDFC